MRPSGVITLTTDFGDQDPYLAMMKGVILRLCPAARLVDVTHRISPGDILEGALVLAETAAFFPKGTIHLAVIDPGVGGLRRPMLACCDWHYFVGPDNGLCWPLMRGRRGATFIQLTHPAYFLPRVSKTFHGRDIFAPAAAHLACGAEPTALGVAITDPVRLDPPEIRRVHGALEGQVVRVDRFGNLLSNISRQDLESMGGAADLLVQVGRLQIKGVSGTYSEVEPGEAVALVGSSDFLEVAVNRGSACERLGVDVKEARGMCVIVTRS